MKDVSDKFIELQPEKVQSFLGYYRFFSWPYFLPPSAALFGMPGTRESELKFLETDLGAHRVPKRRL